MAKAKGGVRPNSGRKPGSKNERTLQWEALGETLLTAHSERANQILASCDDDTFLENYSKLLEYFKPKLARTEVKNDGVQQVNITFNREK